jgi:hypothetical protein
MGVVVVVVGGNGDDEAKGEASKRADTPFHYSNLITNQEIKNKFPS